MRKKKNLHERPVFAVVGDGECEQWYFQMLQRNEPLLTISIKPEIPQKKRLDDQYEFVCACARDYTKVFWIVDLDTILRETATAKKGSCTSLQKFKTYKQKLAKKHSNVKVIINNPCLEFWFLLHFEQTGRYYSNCDEIVSLLTGRNYLAGYQKTRAYFTKQNDDIYQKLRPHLEAAFTAAQRNGMLDFNDPEQMHLFFMEEAVMSQVGLI